MSFQRAGRFKAEVPGTTLVIKVPDSDKARLLLHLQAYNDGSLPPELARLMFDVHDQLRRK